MRRRVGFHSSGWFISPVALPALFCAGACLATPGSVLGQSGDPLEAAELAADAGDVDRARQYLSEWTQSSASTATRDDRGQALVLRARLTEDADSAELAYMEAAVVGGEEYGALARLRLAQLRLMSGRARLAIDDLDLLRDDFPASERVPESWLWTGFAFESLGDPASACAAWAEAAGSDPTDPVNVQATAGLLACSDDSAVDGSASRYTVQLGAFGTRGAADDVRARASSAGSDAWVQEPDDSTPLYRVRVGHFSRKEDAARMAVDLRSRGLEAIVVADRP
ncbi:MAG: SPOR domain-containing protein [marine benthic group bacterium]|nr:SPOR domain-containing protein [Gemmatimonadota bacterium]MCL7978791.1 SPOR domain-containing protein [Gemmatimonadota bacterium]MCL7983636.1 SPOR domain-containing protein [Gemmatimonadota bacterium]